MASEDHEVAIPNIAGRVTVEAAGLFSAPKLLVDGQPAPAGAKRGSFTLRRVNGSEVRATLKRATSRTLPSVVVDGVTYEAGDGIPIPMVVLIFAPFALVGIGGCLGGMLGGLAFGVNSAIARSTMAMPIKFAAMVGVAFGAVVLYLVIALVLRGALSN
jgi:hypothetical protein